MKIIKELLKEKFRQAKASPFLFVGSGFSRRYLGLENWEGLLRRFTTELPKPFEFYLSSTNSELPKTAALISKDFHKLWWESDSYRQSREQHKTRMTKESSPLRVEICEYLKSLSLSCNNIQYEDEFKLIKNLNVDGIITTNWERLLETLFNEYQVYIGQQGLLFSNSQSIGEIYKIHGCCTEPNSLVLTDDDYKDFNDRNAYLAAKLITIFVEHPVIFIGYSLSDPNIAALLSSIAKCIGENKIDKLRNNLIFVRRLHGNESEGVSDTSITLGEVQIPIVLVKTESFVPVYEAISETKRKMPAHILRFYKEQLYEVVRTNRVEDKIAVIDIEKIEEQIRNKGDIDFVIGVGIANESRKYLSEQENIAELGYKSISVIDLFRDLLFSEIESKFSAKRILEETIPQLAKSSQFVPVYKYLSMLGITDQKKYEISDYKQVQKCIFNFDGYKTKGYDCSKRPEYKEKTAMQIIELLKAKPENAAKLLCSLEPNKVNKGVIKEFLVEHFDKFKEKSCTEFRKLACYYDKLVYGWSEN